MKKSPNKHKNCTMLPAKENWKLRKPKARKKPQKWNDSKIKEKLKRKIKHRIELKITDSAQTKQQKET